jgi:hypothetical protein
MATNNRVSKALGDRFAFTLKNTGAATKVVALLAAFFDTLLVTAVTDAGTHVTTVTKSYTDAAAIAAAGYACDAVLDDGTIITGLVATSGNAEMSIRQFREYLKCQGKQLIDMTVQANNVAAFNQAIKLIKCTPLGGSKPDYLYLTDFKSVDQSANDKINVRDLNLDMDFDTLMLMPIAPGHEVSITLIFS